MEVNRTRHLIEEGKTFNEASDNILEDLTGSMDFPEISVEQDNAGVYSEFREVIFQDGIHMLQTKKSASTTRDRYTVCLVDPRLPR